VRGRAADTVNELQRRLPWTAHRIDQGVAFFVADDLCVELWARRRGADSCQLTVEARAVTPGDATRAVNAIRDVVQEHITVPVDEFRVLWAFRGARDELVLASVEEPVDFRLADLVLQGAPGTGKTQLIRAIAAALSRRKQRRAEIFYSNDQSVLHSDEFFVKFATGDADAMVLEDADHHLLACSSGNTELHRMLGVSDGIIRAQGRRMIFSTNLPNLHDLDAVLVQAGESAQVDHGATLAPGVAVMRADAAA